MTVYLSNRLTAPIQTSPSAGLSAGGVYAIYASVATPSTFTTTDTASMFYLPAGARVLYSILKSTDIDSGATITLDAGDAGSQNRYIAASTAGQAATATVSTAVGGLDYLNTAKTLVSIVPAAGPATTAGTISLAMLYVFEGVAS